MLAVLLIYFAVVVYGVKFKSDNTGEYLSIENTTAIKGIFILMVFLSHFNSYIELNGRFDGIYIKFFYIIGQAMVTMFLFYSGYGIMESIKKKGDSYIYQIPVKRVLATLFKFDCAIVLFFIMGLVFSTPMSVKKVLLSLIGWESIGNSNWYIFVILLLYILTFIVFKITGTKKLFLSSLILTVLIGILVLITAKFKIKETHWYDTALCFAVGMIYSLFKEKIAKVVNHNIFIWGITVALSFFLYFALKDMGFLCYLVANLCFAFGIVAVTMRVTLKNKVLVWCGKNLFEIYILQRIPMFSLKALGVADFNIFVYFGLCLVITVLLTLGFSFVVNKAWNMIAGKRNNK